MNGKALDSVLDTAVPPQLLTSDLKTLLVKACAKIDGLGLIDPKTNQLYVNEDNVRDALLTVASPNTVERFLSRLKATPDLNKFIAARDADRQGLQPIKWLDFASKIPVFKPLPDFTYRSIGLHERSSEAEIRDALKRHFPAISDAWFDADKLKRDLSNALGEPPGPPGVVAESRLGVAPESRLGNVIGCIAGVVPFWLIGVVLANIAVWLTFIFFGEVIGIIIAILLGLSLGVELVYSIIYCIEYA